MKIGSFKMGRRIERRLEPTEENIQKIIELNDGLHERFRMVFEDLMAMKAKVDVDIKKGEVRCSGYTMYPEYFFAYSYDDAGIPTADGDTLMDLCDRTRYFFPHFQLTADSPIPDFETDFMQHNELNWNIEALDLLGLESHYIYYFMHAIFVDSGAFCVGDIPYLKPEDLQWQITVEYEQFDR
jgi:hypothetical protein